MGTLSNRGLSSLKPSNIKRTEFTDFYSLGSNVASSAITDNYFANIVNFKPGKGNEWEKRPGTSVISEVLLDGLSAEVVPDHQVMWYDDFGLRVYYLKDGVIYNVKFSAFEAPQLVKQDWYSYEEIYHYNYQYENTEKTQTVNGEYFRNKYDDPDYDASILSGKTNYNFLVTSTYAIWTIGEKMLYMPISGGWGGIQTLVDPDTGEQQDRAFLIPYVDPNKGIPVVTQSAETTRRAWLEVASQVQDIYVYTATNQINYYSKSPGHRVESFSPLTDDSAFMTIYNDGLGVLKANLAKEYVNLEATKITKNIGFTYANDKVDVISAYRELYALYNNWVDAGNGYGKIGQSLWAELNKDADYKIDGPYIESDTPVESSLNVKDIEDFDNLDIDNYDENERILLLAEELRRTKNTKSIKSLIRKYRIKRPRDIFAAENLSKSYTRVVEGMYRQHPHFKTLIFNKRGEDTDFKIQITAEGIPGKVEPIRRGKDDTDISLSDFEILTTADFIEKGITNQDNFFEYLLNTGNIVSNEDGTMQMKGINIEVPNTEASDILIPNNSTINLYSHDDRIIQPLREDTGKGKTWEFMEGDVVSRTAQSSEGAIQQVPQFYPGARQGEDSTVIDAVDRAAKKVVQVGGKLLLITSDIKTGGVNSYEYNPATGKHNLTKNKDLWYDNIVASTDLTPISGSENLVSKHVTDIQSNDNFVVVGYNDGTVLILDSEKIIPRETAALGTFISTSTFRTYGTIYPSTSVETTSIGLNEDNLLTTSDGQVYDLTPLLTDVEFAEYVSSDPTNPKAFIAFDANTGASISEIKNYTNVLVTTSVDYTATRVDKIVTNTDNSVIITSDKVWNISHADGATVSTLDIQQVIKDDYELVSYTQDELGDIYLNYWPDYILRYVDGAKEYGYPMSYRLTSEGELINLKIHDDIELPTKTNTVLHPYVSGEGTTRMIARTKNVSGKIDIGNYGVIWYDSGSTDINLSGNLLYYVYSKTNASDAKFEYTPKAKLIRFFETLEIEVISEGKDTDAHLDLTLREDIGTSFLYYNRSWLSLNNDRLSRDLWNESKDKKLFATLPVYGESEDIGSLGYGLPADYYLGPIHGSYVWTDVSEFDRIFDYNYQNSNFQKLVDYDYIPFDILDDPIQSGTTMQMMPAAGGDSEDISTWGYKLGTIVATPGKYISQFPTSNSTNSENDDFLSFIMSDMTVDELKEITGDDKLPPYVGDISGDVLGLNANPYSFFDTIIDQKEDESKTYDGIQINQTVTNMLDEAKGLIFTNEVNNIDATVNINIKGLVMVDGNNVALDLVNMSTKNQTNVPGDSNGFNTAIAEGLGSDVSKVMANSYKDTDIHIARPDNYVGSPNIIANNNILHQPYWAKLATRKQINGFIIGPSEEKMKNNIRDIALLNPFYDYEEYRNVWTAMNGHVTSDGMPLKQDDTVIYLNEEGIRIDTWLREGDGILGDSRYSPIGGLSDYDGIIPIDKLAPALRDGPEFLEMRSTLTNNSGYEVSPRPIKEDVGVIKADTITVNKIYNNTIEGRIQLYDKISGTVYYDSGIIEGLSANGQIEINFNNFVTWLKTLTQDEAGNIAALPLEVDVDVTYRKAFNITPQPIPLTNKDYIGTVLINALINLADKSVVDSTTGSLDLDNIENEYKITLANLSSNQINNESLISVDWYYKQALKAAARVTNAENTTGDSTQVLGLVTQSISDKVQANTIQGESIADPVYRIVPSVQTNIIGNSVDGTGTFSAEDGVVSIQLVFNSSSFSKSPLEIFRDFFDVDKLGEDEPYFIRKEGVGFTDGRWQYGVTYDQFVTAQPGGGVLLLNVTIPVSSSIWIDAGESFILDAGDDGEDGVTYEIQENDLAIARDNIGLISSYITSKIVLFSTDGLPQDKDLSMTDFFNGEIVSISTFDDKIVTAFEDKVYVSESTDPSKFVYRLENLPTNIGKILKVLPFAGAIMIIFERGYCTYSPEYSSSGILQFTTPLNVKISPNIINGDCVSVNTASVDVLTTEGVLQIWNYTSTVTQVPQLTSSPISTIINNKLLNDLENSERASMFNLDDDVYINLIVKTEEGTENKLYIYTDGKDLLSSQKSKWYIWEGYPFDVRQMETYKDNDGNIRTLILPRHNTEVYQLGYKYNIRNEGDKLYQVDGHLDRAKVTVPEFNNDSINVTSVGNLLLSKTDTVEGIPVTSIIETNALGSENIYDAKWKDYSVVLNNHGFEQQYYRKHFVLDSTTGQFVDQNVSDDVYEVISFDMSDEGLVKIVHNKKDELDMAQLNAINVFNTKGSFDLETLYTTIGSDDELNIEDKVALGSAKASQFKIKIAHYDDKPFTFKKIRTTLKLKKHK